MMTQVSTYNHQWSKGAAMEYIPSDEAEDPATSDHKAHGEDSGLKMKNQKAHDRIKKSTQVVSQAVLTPSGSCNQSRTHGERMPQIHGCFDQSHNIVSVCLLVA
jgi:hypothetical protein